MRMADTERDEKRVPPKRGTAFSTHDRRSSSPLGRFVVLLGLLASLLTPFAASAQALDERDVLVVFNGASPVSRAAAYYYAFSRGLSRDMLLELQVPLVDPMLGAVADEQIGRASYEALIRDPVAARLAELGDEAPLFIATVMGVPLRIPDDSGSPILLLDSTGASVDAELAVLGSSLEGSAGIVGSNNPYFGSLAPFAEWRAANPDSPLRYLVTRIAGYQDQRDAFHLPASVRTLVDGAQATPDPSAAWVVDESGIDSTLTTPVDLNLLRPASGLLRFLGHYVLHDMSTEVLHDVHSVVGLASWGSNDPNSPSAPYYGEIAGAVYPGTFAPRSIVATVVSTNARSFVAPPVYGQSLVADLVREGANGVAGTVAEPGAFQISHPQVLFARYAIGSTAAEAHYASLPYLGWQNVFVGDPLMRLSDPDADGDGVEDRIDDCAETPAGLAVDAAGCSVAQFCGALSPSADYEPMIHACTGADWNGNETSSREPKDCRVVSADGPGLACVVGEDSQ